MANITDVDQFDATIEVPTSGQLASANDIRDKFVQKLANRTRNLKNRLDTTDASLALYKSAVYSVSGTAVAFNSKVTLTQDFASSGITVASDEISVPANGVYLVSFCASVYETTSASANFDVGVKVLKNASTILYIVGTRSAASTSVGTLISGTALVQISAFATDKIKVLSGVTGGSTHTYSTVSSDSKLSVAFIHA